MQRCTSFKHRISLEGDISVWISSVGVAQTPSDTLCFFFPGSCLPSDRCGSKLSCSASPARPRPGWPSGSARCAQPRAPVPARWLHGRGPSHLPPLQIALLQGMRADTGALLALCEKTENDIRSCINTLQVFVAAGRSRGGEGLLLCLTLLWIQVGIKGRIVFQAGP